MKTRNLKIAALSVLLLLGPVCIAQLPEGSWLEMDMHHGRIFRHTEKIAYRIPASSTGFSGSLNMPLREKGRLRRGGKVFWGPGLQYYFLGDQQVLGQAISGYAQLGFRIVERSHWTWHFRMGTGLSFLSRSYGKIANPLNNAIGSKINNLTFFQTDLNWKLGNRWMLGVGGSFTHFSNAAAQAPNLGINLPAVNLGLSYFPSGHWKQEAGDSEPEERTSRRWGVQTYFCMGYRETAGPGGPKLPVRAGSLAAMYRLSDRQSLSFGAEWEFVRDIYEFALHTYTADSEKQAREMATRHMIFFAFEPRFGQLVLLLQMGAYLGNTAILVPFPLYNKLAIRYYFPELKSLPLDVHLGVYMKSHLITAEYFGLGIGVMMW